MMVELFNQAGR